MNVLKVIEFNYMGELYGIQNVVKKEKFDEYRNEWTNECRI